MCKSPGLLCSSKLEDNKALEVVASFPSTAVLLPASLLPSLLGLQSQICKRFDWTSEAQPELCGVGVQQCTGMLNAVFHTLSAAFWCIHWKKKKKNWIPQHGKQTTGQTTGSALAGIQHLAGNSSSQIHLAPSLLTFFFFWLLHKGCSALITLQLLWQRMGMLRSQRKAVELWAKGLPSP